jgi:hypothetical protein
MQRIIEGKAYNTATALHVAHAEEYEWQDEGTTRVTTRYDLYRTQGGAFFLTIEEEILTGIGLTRQTDPVIGVELHPLGYDEAHSFARGETVQIGRLHLRGKQIDLLAPGIFPTVEEAVDQSARPSDLGVV